jgi:hypothetical protein
MTKRKRKDKGKAARKVRAAKPIEEVKEISLKDFFLADIKDTAFHFQRRMWALEAQQYTIAWNTEMFIAGKSPKEMVDAVPIGVYFNAAFETITRGGKISADFAKLIINAVNNKMMMIESRISINKEGNLDFQPLQCVGQGT